MADEDKKVSTNRAKKETIVAELVSDVEKAKAIVFTNYQGLTHKQIEGLKNAIRPLDADVVVAKNTLLKIALEKGNVKIDKVSSLEGPTATLFLFGDVITPLKSLAKTIKELNLPTIKFAIIDGKETSADDVIKLSALPSREVLLAQVAVALKSPISGLHRALSWNLQKLVMTLNAVAAAKPAMAAAPVAQPAAPVSEPAVEPNAEPAETTSGEASQPTDQQGSQETSQQVNNEASEPTAEAPIEATPAEEAVTEQPTEVENTEQTESETQTTEPASEEVKTEGGEN